MTTQSAEFLNRVLDSITAHIAVLDEDGTIVYVNRSWENFGRENTVNTDTHWPGVNYLAVCDRAAAEGDESAAGVAEGIRSVMHGEQDLFYDDYPCHSPDKKRWFVMRVTPFSLNGQRHFVITHQDITPRKLAEEKILNLSRSDGLTNIANRRAFDDFLDNEWKRCLRQHTTLSLAILDLDHFKILNDTYGHQAGDDCLKQVAQTIQQFAQRPNDLCARYGGEEFAIIYGGTSSEEALALLEKLHAAINALGIPNEEAPDSSTLTASIGLATLQPNHTTDVSHLIRAADTALYVAKNLGRNRIEFYRP